MTAVSAATARNGADVFKATLRNQARDYPGRDDARYDDFLILPSVSPRFRIAENSSVFTIGSCFARNVEEALLERGVEVPTAHYSAEQDKVPGRKNRVLNQYNPGTMLQCVEDAFGAQREGAIYKVGTRDEVVDSLVASGHTAVSGARALERRREISELYRTGLAASDTVVITLGLIETWIDLESGLYLNESPPPSMMRREADRFAFRRLDIDECTALVTRMIDLLIHDRTRNILLTVSPVPLQVTFSGKDAVTANAYSKSVLRVVAETIAESYDMVDYFPSYEVVATAGFRGFGEDNVHVRPVIVTRIVNYMLNQYLEAQQMLTEHGCP